MTNESRSLGLRKGAWMAEEDDRLRNCIEKYGEGKWHQVPFKAGLNRCRKSCRLRWLNYLKPNIKRGEFADDEVDLIIRLHRLLGNRWSLIAGRIPGRTANDVKNHWNTHLRKKLSSVTSKNVAPKPELTQSKPNITFKPSAVIIKPRPLTFSENVLPFFSDRSKSSTRDDIDGETNINVPSSADGAGAGGGLWTSEEWPAMTDQGPDQWANHDHNQIFTAGINREQVGTCCLHEGGEHDYDIDIWDILNSDYLAF